MMMMTMTTTAMSGPKTENLHSNAVSKRFSASQSFRMHVYDNLVENVGVRKRQK